MTPPRELADAGERTPRRSLATWVWPPLLAVGLLLGYTAIRDGGLDLDPELIIPIVVFLVVAAAVGLFGRRYESRQERGGRKWQPLAAMSGHAAESRNTIGPMALSCVVRLYELRLRLLAGDVAPCPG